MSLQTTLTFTLSATSTDSVDLEVPSSGLSYSPSYTFSDGGGANQAKSMFSDTRILTASSSETINVRTFTDELCNAVTNTAIKIILIRAHVGNTNDVVFGPNSSTGFVSPFNAVSDRVSVKPGGIAVLVAPNAAGYATSGTTNLLFVQNSGATTSVTYDIVLIGAA